MSSHATLICCHLSHYSLGKTDNMMPHTSLTASQRTKASLWKLAPKTFGLALEAFSQSFLCYYKKKLKFHHSNEIHICKCEGNSKKQSYTFHNIYRVVCYFLALLQKLHDTLVFVVLEWIKTWIPQRWWTVLPIKWYAPCLKFLLSLLSCSSPFLSFVPSLSVFHFLHKPLRWISGLFSALLIFHRGTEFAHSCSRLSL